MKKNRVLMTITLALTLALSAFALAACGAKAHKCGSVCPDCGQCTSDCADEACKDKCPGHNLTEGVYNCKMGSYDLLIKFYDAETYYFQTEMKGFRGKYEIKDEKIVFAATQGDGSILDTPTHGDKAKWLTGNKTIYFYQEDGVTPIDYTISASEKTAHDPTTVPAGIGYAYGTKPHTLAYNAAEDKIMSFKGEYGSRTLSHTTGRNFTVNDEKAIEQAKFMVATLPDGAEGKVESDYFLILSQKGYETNIPALEAWELTNGKFKKEGDVYTLTDTISGATATLTVTETGAVVQKGEESVNLVAWEDVTPYAAEINGSLYNKIFVRIRFNEDGTLTIYGSGKNYGGKYKAAKDGTITISEIDADCPVAFTTAAFSAGGGETTITASVTVKTGPSDSVTVDNVTGVVTGKLFGLAASTMLEVESDEAVFQQNKMKLEMLDNATLTLSVGGQTKVTAFWNLDTETRQITFKKVSAGSFAYTLAGTVTVTWTGRLSDTEQEDKTYTFKFPATDLGKLQGAAVEEKLVAAGEPWQTRETKAVFYADGSLKVDVAGNAIATAEWTFAMNGRVPSVTIADCSNGTMTAAFGSGETDGKYVFTWTGKVNPQMPSDSVLTFAIDMAELAKLM